MKKDIKVYLQDIIDSLTKIEQYIKSIDEKEFFNNSQLQDAIFRRLEIIGEATKNIPQPFRNKYPNIPWKQIAGMRDVLIHEYDSVDIDRIWQVAKNDVPKLKQKIKKINKKLNISK